MGGNEFDVINKKNLENEAKVSMRKKRIGIIHILTLIFRCISVVLRCF